MRRASASPPFWSFPALLLLAAGLCLWLAALQPHASGQAERASPVIIQPEAAASTVPPNKKTYIPAPLRRSPLPGPILVEPLRVIDGDTFEGKLRVWFGQEITTLIRLRNVDAPELKARCPAEAQLAEEARQTLEDILHSGTILLTDVGLDKYAGRVVANAAVVARQGGAPAAADDIGTLMLAGGYARPYQGGRRQGWCS